VHECFDSVADGAGAVLIFEPQPGSGAELTPTIRGVHEAPDRLSQIVAVTRLDNNAATVKNGGQI
jgi:hypothetical protein